MSLIVAEILLSCLDIYALYRLAGSDRYTRNQKALQLFLIFLFPLVGAIIVLMMLKPPKDPPPSDFPPAPPINPNIWPGSRI